MLRGCLLWLVALSTAGADHRISQPFPVIWTQECIAMRLNLGLAASVDTLPYSKLQLLKIQCSNLHDKNGRCLHANSSAALPTCVSMALVCLVMSFSALWSLLSSVLWAAAALDTVSSESTAFWCSFACFATCLTLELLRRGPCLPVAHAADIPRTYKAVTMGQHADAPHQAKLQRGWC